MTSPLEWTYPAAEIGQRGISETRHATPDELIEIARVLDLLACESLAVRYDVKPLSAGRFRFSGELEAKVTQACVVTLEPVGADISEQFDIELRPIGEMELDGVEGEQEILSVPDIEPIEDGCIDAGSLVLAVLSSALEPYPRKEGAEFGWKDPKAESTARDSNPFSVLAKLNKDS